MSCVADATAEEHLSGHPVALDVLARVRAFLEEHGPVEERVTRSQVAFRCVLSVALGRHDDSPRFKEVVHPSPRHWMHHLEIRDAAEVDDEVRAWLWEAADRAG